MEQTNEKALRYSASSTRLMIAALLVAVLLAVVSARTMAKSILEPIVTVTQAAREVSQGNLDQVVPTTTSDELGELGQAFNTMARTIREYREAGTMRLLRAQKTAQATIDSFPDPVVVVDPQGCVERANPAAQRLLKAIPGGEDDSVPWIAPSPLQPHLASVLGGNGDYLPLTLDQAMFVRDGNQDRYYLPRVLRIRSDSGELLGAAVVLSDVTKFHLVDQLKSDMISTVSHELKTPLTSLQMVVHLLLEEAVGPLTTKQTELLLAARQDSDRLLGMINDLLDLTRIEQGRVALDQGAVDPSELVHEAVERHRVGSKDAGIGLEIQLAPTLPPVLVDRERIEHVFDNLLSNALRHTDRGGTIILRAVPVDGAVEFSIEDTGEGIAPEYLPRIFDKFFRAPGAKHQGGAGLGLAIVREIVLAHGGQIEAASTPGKGTTFTLQPTSGDRTGGRGREPSDRRPWLPSPGKPMNARKCILIVDDESNVRLVFRTALEASGYEVSEASDGGVAMAQLRKRPFDLMLLDLNMPEVGGMETLRRLRASQIEVPVIVITAHGGVAEAVAAVKLGAVDFLPKPVSPASLRAVVASACERQVTTRERARSVADAASDQAALFEENLDRTRQAMDRREYEDAEFFLRVADALNRGSEEVLRLREALESRKHHPERFSFRSLGDILQ